MLKRILIIALAFITSCGFVACGDDNTSSSSDETRQEIKAGFYKDLEEENKYYVTSPEGLITFGGIINEDIYHCPPGYSSRIFKNATVEIESDIDMTDRIWTAMQLLGVDGLTIDGNGHKISNLSLSSYNNIPNADNNYGENKLGFIGEARSNITLKNLTFDNACVESSGKWVSVVCGYHLVGSLHLENVDVINSEIVGSFSNDDSKRIGMLIGLTQFYDDTVELYLTDCDVDNCKITGYESIAGLVGTFSNFTNYIGRWGISNCSVTNCVFRAGNREEKYVNTFVIAANDQDSLPHAYFEELGNRQADNTIELGVIR